MSDFPELNYSANIGDKGFQRIDTSSTVTGDFIAVKAINGNATFGSECDTKAGDAPSSSDRILEGDILFAPFSAVDISSGVVYAYHRP